ncbi:MAG: hypothetical protein PHH06_02660 [Candidatus Gracilibacteria bacterium]|nr:hypothetical protein [Candidatus Gracilibacteria bacterium]
MSFKETLKTSFNDTEKMTSNRFKASSIMFISVTLLFFLNYFFVGANFYYEYFIKTLPYIYILFLLSFLMYFYFAIISIFKISKPLYGYLILFVLVIIFVLFSTLFVVRF